MTSPPGFGTEPPPDDQDDEALLDLAEHFNQVDTDGDRRIDFAEFSRLIEDLDEGMTREALRIGFREIDTDHDGVIDFREFADWWRQR